MIVLGFGFRQNAQAGDFLAMIDKMGDLKPTHIATAEGKDQHAGLLVAAQEHGLTVIAIAPEALKTQVTPTQSEKSQALFATGSLCEAAALAAAGPKAYVLRPRQISDNRNVTCAAAKGMSA